MKTFSKIASAILLLCLTLTANSQWIQTEGPQGGRGNCMARANNGIWLGTNQGIYISNNEGISWNKSNLFADKEVYSIYALDDAIIIGYSDVNGAGGTGMISTSFDLGATWSTPVSIGAGPISRCQNTFISNGQLSYDFGFSWSPIQPVSNSGISGVINGDSVCLVYIINTNTGITKWYLSTDGLHTWQLVGNAAGYDNFYMNNDELVCTFRAFDTIQKCQMLRSTDYGLSWDTLYTAAPGAFLYSPLIVNGGYFVAVSHSPNYYSLYSYNNGASWVQGEFPKYITGGVTLSNGEILMPHYMYTAMRYLPAQDTFYACNTGIKGSRITNLASNKNVIFASTDLDIYTSINTGVSWQATGLNFKKANQMVFFGDTVVAVGDSYIARSVDNGYNWTKTQMPYNIQDVYTICKIGNRAYIAMDSFYYSDDYGATWTTFTGLPNQPGLYSAAPVCSMNGELFSVSNDGVIYHYNTINAQWDSLVTFWSPGAHNANELYNVGGVLVMSGRDELMISSDSGLTWTYSRLGGLPVDMWGDPLVIPKHITYHNGLWIAIGYTMGVIISTNMGDSWFPLQPGTSPFIATGGVAFLNDILYSGSYFNGVWRRGGVLEAISGHVFYDENNNGIKDSGEPPIPNNIVCLKPSGFTATTDNQGNYTAMVDVTGDTLRAVKQSLLYDVQPDHYITAGAAQNKDFAIQIAPNIADLSVDATCTSAFRPGFQNTIVITVKNYGSMPQAPVVKFVLDQQLHILSSTPPANISGDTLIWNLNTVPFLNSAQITLRVQTPPSLAINSPITAMAIVWPTLNDVNILNNFFILRDVVVGSYDPNDKQCAQGDMLTPTQVENGEELVFTVRFQNTGNYQADFVHIADTLSPFLDLSTFRVIASSHQMRWSMQGQGIVNFHFDSIMLPPSSQDEPGSYGFVKYGVRCKPTTKLGDGITNTAYIYFDFNTAIITNTTATLVGLPAGLNDLQNPGFTANIPVYPNPTADVLNIPLWGLQTGASNLQVYNLAGAQIAQEQITSASLHTLSVKSLPAGFYIGIIKSSEGTTTGNFKFVVEH